MSIHVYAIHTTPTLYINIIFSVFSWCRSTSIHVEYIQGVSGTGRPSVVYPQLAFKPNAFIAMGSPIGIFLSARGVDKVGEDFKLPTCQRIFNVFHPVRETCFLHFIFSVKHSVLAKCLKIQISSFILLYLIDITLSLICWILSHDVEIKLHISLGNILQRNITYLPGERTAAKCNFISPWGTYCSKI